MPKRTVGRPKKENPLKEQVSFRVTEEDFEKLEKMAKKLNAGTAHTFVRDLAERVIKAGSAEVWGVENEKV